jgi:hypothetical protein
VFPFISTSTSIAVKFFEVQKRAFRRIKRMEQNSARVSAVDCKEKQRSEANIHQEIQLLPTWRSLRHTALTLFEIGTVQ